MRMKHRIGLALAVALATTLVARAGTAKDNPNDEQATTCRFKTLALTVGMKREKVEDQVAALLGQQRSYSPYGNNLTGGAVTYRDGNWTLEVVYKAGAPAPWIRLTDGSAQHYRPVDETVLDYNIRKLPDKPVEQARAVAEALDAALGGGTNFAAKVVSRDFAVIWRDAAAMSDKEIVPNEHGWVLEVRAVFNRLDSQKDWPDFRDDGKGEIRGFVGRIGISGGKKIELGRGLVLRYGKSVDKAVFAAFCSPQRDKFNPLAISLLAQTLFHRACDDWESAAVHGQPTADAAERIRFAQRLHVDAYLNGSPLIPNAAIFVPYPIVYAGKVASKDGGETSYMVGPMQGGVGVGVWRRGSDPLSVHQGFAAKFGFANDGSKLRFGAVQRVAGKPFLLRIRYETTATQGWLRVRFDGQHWGLELEGDIKEQP